jgi:2-C-methyl-D-erythritol 4-phosphate cytidylyltransferase
VQSSAPDASDEPQDEPRAGNAPADGASGTVPGVPTDCLAVVTVDADDRSAPLGCAALRLLGGRPLLLWALSALVSSGVAREVVVAVPPVLAEAVARAVPVTDVPVEVLPVRADGPGHRLLAALRARPAPAGIVVVHDPLHPLSPAALVRDVVRDLLGPDGGAASVPARPVTDTLKWIGEDQVVRGTADREEYRMIYSPQAYRRQALQGALEAADDAVLRAHGSEVLPQLVQRRGGLVRLVPSTGEAFRMAGADDLVLAEALLRVGGADG